MVIFGGAMPCGFSTLRVGSWPAAWCALAWAELQTLLDAAESQVVVHRDDMVIS